MPSSSLVHSTHLSKRKGEDVHAEEEFAWHLPTAAANEELPVRGWFFSLLDGHGGVESAELARDGLLSEFLCELTQLSITSSYASSRQAFDELHGQALTRAFTSLDRQAQAKFERSGATCTVVIVISEPVNAVERPPHRVFLTVANVGDSHAYLAVPSSSSAANMTRISEDHRAGANKHEIKRVEDTVGWELSRKADAKGPLRLFPGGLMMTRSLGDREAGACCLGEPSITRVCAPSTARIVLASDGLWDSLSMKEIGKLAHHKPDPVQCSRALMTDAAKREGKFGDDVTVTVIDLQAGGFNSTSPDDAAAAVWTYREAAGDAPEAFRLLASVRSDPQYRFPDSDVLPFPVGSLVTQGGEEDGQQQPRTVQHYDFGGELCQLSGSKRWVATCKLAPVVVPVVPVVEVVMEQPVVQEEPEAEEAPVVVVAEQSGASTTSRKSSNKPKNIPNKKKIASKTHPAPPPPPANDDAATEIPAAPKKKKADEVAHMFFCTGFPAKWTLKQLRLWLETKFKSRLARCTLKHNPDMPQERGVFFSLAKRVAFSKVCQAHVLEGQEGEEGEGEQVLLVVRTRDAFPEFYKE